MERTTLHSPGSGAGQTRTRESQAAHCRGRFGADVAAGEALPAIEHGFTHYRLTILPQRVVVKRWPSRVESPGLAWLTPADATGAALPAPIRKLLRAL